MNHIKGWLRRQFGSWVLMVDQEEYGKFLTYRGAEHYGWKHFQLNAWYIQRRSHE